VKDDVVKKPIRFEKGHVHVPEGPGLGVELDESKLKKYSKGVIALE
jgi:muconate cycloisomerase